ncbi:MAG: hypothetical protein RL235_410, partial [Chlamydiota bacterium]|jgi:glycosyltransferase involved in cell wall biosynthesis
VQNEAIVKQGYFKNAEIHTSFIQRLPRAKSKYRSYLPLFPLAIEQFDLSSYDLILSSSHCVAKGVITSPDQLHICYCYTPVRYAWDLMHTYLKESNLDKGVKGMLARLILHYIRGWDANSSARVDHFIAISSCVARRIQKYYGRKAEVIFPPVNTAFYELETKKDSYYITASRFVPYKRIDLIVEAFTQMPHQRLIVIGDGPDWEKVKAKAGNNVELLGYQPDSSLRSYLQKAKGFVFAAQEDFGILPVEAMACGTPVLAYSKGGAQDTVIPGKTGLFFQEQTVAAFINGINAFERTEFDPHACRQQAENFSEEVFKSRFQKFVSEKYTERG